MTQPWLEKRGIALALQGGGAHGAFAWGVLDRLIEDGLVPDRVCGVSSGALLATMLVQGMVQGGPDGARRSLRRLWQSVADLTAPLDHLFGGWESGTSLIWQGMEAALRMFSPSQINPFGHHPLRQVLENLLDTAALADPAAARLTVSATDVETGCGVLFGNTEITVDVLLASTCLPFAFPPVQLGGRAYWDGGYAGNPPLAPLLQPDLPDELILIRAQARRRRGVPTTQPEILNRMTEIACQNVLEAELAALPAGLRLTSYEADRALAELPISSKYNTGSNFLERLFASGRGAMAIP